MSRSDRVELAKIPALTFYEDALTKGRRTDPIPQLTCIGSACKHYKPEVVRCQSLPGGSGTEVDWKCEADLPDSLRFGKVEVSCEGWSRPGDPFVLKGSCGLQYRLVQIPNSYKQAESNNFASRRSSSMWPEDIPSAIFMIIWISVLGVIVYSFLKSCFQPRHTTVRRDAPRPPPGPSAGGGGGGWFPGGGRPDDYDNDSPPPYSKYNANAPGSAGDAAWRPGFWTGAALGGAASYLWNNRGARNREPNVNYDQRGSAFSQQQRPTGSSSGFWGGSQRQATSSSYDRGEGSSNLGSMRRSTAFGGSSVR